MNTKLILIWIVGFTFSLFSCSNESNKSIGEKESEVIVDPNLPEDSPVILVLNIEDIKSFNLTTKEIVFSVDTIIEKLRTMYTTGLTMYNSSRSDRVMITFNYNNRPLFDSIPLTSPVSSTMINDLVFIIKLYQYESILFLSNGYPEEIPPLNTEKLQKEAETERKENVERRKMEWDIYINYLFDSNKIIE